MEISDEVSFFLVDKKEFMVFCRIPLIGKNQMEESHMSWLNASGSRGDWFKAKEGENFHGYSNKENEKTLETLLKMPPGDKGTFFTPMPKKW